MYLALNRVSKYSIDDRRVGQHGCVAWEWYIIVYCIAVAVATAVEALNIAIRYLNEVERPHYLAHNV